LELGHVVPAKHGAAEVEEAAAELVAGLDQGAPGLPSTDPVDPEAPTMLERLEGGPGARAEVARGVRCPGEAQVGEAALEVGDRRSVVGGPERET
jgi:hypothetical protein